MAQYGTNGTLFCGKIGAAGRQNGGKKLCLAGKAIGFSKTHGFFRKPKKADNDKDNGNEKENENDNESDMERDRETACEVARP